MSLWINSFLIEYGIPIKTSQILSYGIIFVLTIFLSWVSYYIGRMIVLKIVYKIVKDSSNQFDDILLKNHVFHLIANIAPGLIIFIFSYDFPEYQSIIQRFVYAYFIVISLLIFSAIITSVEDIYNTLDISKEKSIKGFTQLIKIFVFVIGCILIFSTILNQSPWKLISGIGAMTAVLLLVFKDSIMGLVASVQISANNMVKIGDWVEMPKYGADGDVIEITLHTLKVQNFDKTITTIPIYALTSESFKNWRGMRESGGRRIKRSIFIDVNTIKFCTDEMLKKFETIDFVSDYLKVKEEEFQTVKKDFEPKITNVGVLRAYILSYLKHHPQINHDMTVLVRHLQPTEHGLPIEIYGFCKDKVWANYEKIQSDIFDHIFAIVPEFELKIFQNPTGNDFQAMVNSPY